MFCPKSFCGIWSKTIILILKWNLWLCLHGSWRLGDVNWCLWVRFYYANWSNLSTASHDDRSFISGWASVNISESLDAGEKHLSIFLTSWSLGQVLTCLAYSCAWYLFQPKSFYDIIPTSTGAMTDCASFCMLKAFSKSIEPKRIGISFNFLEQRDIFSPLSHAFLLDFY